MKPKKIILLMLVPSILWPSCISSLSYGDEMEELEAEVDRLEEENRELMELTSNLHQKFLLITFQLDHIKQMSDSLAIPDELKEALNFVEAVSQKGYKTSFRSEEDY